MLGVGRIRRAGTPTAGESPRCGLVHCRRSSGRHRHGRLRPPLRVAMTLVGMVWITRWTGMTNRWHYHRL